MSTDDFTPDGPIPGRPTAQNDVRPQVARRSTSNRGVWLFGGGLVVAGLLLFQALEARRTGIVSPSTIAPADSGTGTVGSPPSLVIPPEQQDQFQPYGAWPQPVMVRPVPAPVVPAPATPPSRNSRSAPPIYPYFQPPVQTVASGNGGVRDGFAGPPTSGSPSLQGAPAAGATTASKDRVQATRLANPATTVSKGTVIQAVLESALDSTRGGFARAIVSRDIYSFDGTRVLVQRGSRLIGEYKSDVSAGQNRILIQWQRLIRPDGVLIELDSPSADPLGRAGIKGSVNTHFFARFGGAILQSTLDIGTQLAARAASHDTVVLALPGSIQQGTQIVQPDRIAPTVKVRQGTSVSVFVAKDLDFTDVEK